MNLRLRLLFTLSLSANIIISFAQLPQSSWQCRKFGDTSGWIPATVPGTIHTDLLNQNIIPDPFYRDNEQKLQWIDREDWEYQTTFTANPETLAKNHIELVFDGIDTYADVFLNDTKILEANNMFRTWTIDVKQILKPNNKLYILFHSAQNRVEALAKNDAPFQWPTTDYPRMYARKAQYSFGWDWGPKFTTCGLWKNVHINAWDNLQVNNAHFKVTSLTNQLAKINVTYQLNANEAKSAVIHLQDNAPIPAFNITKQVVLHKGVNSVSLNFNVINPKKWFTYQLGTPYLYNAKTTITSEKEPSIVSFNKFGIRTIELIQQKDEVGQSFYFKLNGIPVYMKGADFIPADAFLPRITKQTYQKQIANAKEANMNMLRVWGGGIYENDDFYDLCDQEGILVWQDLMFACAMYPDDASFLSNVKAELVDNITRLRNHPSIALWCGNNEIDEGWNNWGWKKKFAATPKDELKIANAYKTLFLDTIPATIATLDNTRAYHNSSPLFGWTHDESILFGDQHYWGLWGFEKDVEIFNQKTGRFISEYGMQAMPTAFSIPKFTISQDLDISSQTMKTHQKHPKGYPLLQSYIDKYIPQTTNFDDYIYATNCMQYYVLNAAIQIHRSKMPTNMGSLYWQLNDCWPVASWSTVDYYNQWKGGMYAVKEAYKDVLISIDSSKPNNWSINITNDLPKNITGKLSLSIINFNGNLIDTISLALTAEKQTNTIIDIGNWISKYKNLDNLFVKSNFTVSNKIQAYNCFTLTKPKYLKLSKPTIHIKQLNDSTITVSSNVFAKYVQLSIPNKDVHFKSNYFDIIPNEIKQIQVNSEWNLGAFIKEIQCKSLYDIANPSN